ncbi:HEAT repeat domain-containing protein [Mariniluteicoccus flavus]
MEPLRIGEVARRSGLTVRTLRHWDELGLLTPSARTWGDHRLYDAADLDRLLAIVHLRSLGLSLTDIRQALDDPEFDAEAALADQITAVRSRLDHERRLLERLEQLRDPARRGWSDVLDAVALTTALEDPHAHVRVRAALDAPDSVGVDVLLDRVVGDPDQAVRETLTWALARQDADVVDAVLARLDNADPGVRLQLAHVLSKLHDVRAVPPLVALLRDPDAEVVTKAAFALGRLGDERAIDRLAALLGQGDAGQRDTVASALGGFGEAAVGPVARALGSAAARTREHAAETLGLAGSDAAIGALTAALGDDDAEVRLAAVMALGELPGAGAVVAAARRSEDPRVRGVAARLAR